MRRVALFLVAGLLASTPVTGQTTVAIVVHPDSPTEDISLGDLKRLFEGRTASLDGVTGIFLFQHRASRQQFFRLAMNTTVARATRAWIALVFSGDAAVPPINYDRSDGVMRAVKGRRASIGFVPLSEVDTDLVKILRVGGYTPDDPSYPLR